MNIDSQSKAFSIIIDLLINIQSNQLALHSIIAEDYIVREGEENDLNDRFKQLTNQHRKAMLAQIQANYIMKEDIKDILKGLFTDPEDKW